MARRVAMTAVDWTTLGKRVPVGQKEAFRLLKGQTDKYLAKVTRLPEALPKIDFAEYSNRISNKAVLAEYEKLYEAVSVPYPKDPQNFKTKLDQEEKKSIEIKNEYVKELNVEKKSVQDILDLIDSVPPPEEMTMQMFHYYFPNAAMNPNRENPGVFPQNTRIYQVDAANIGGHDEYLNTMHDRRNMCTLEQADEISRIKVELKRREKEKELQAELEKQAKEQPEAEQQTQPRA